MFSIVCFMFKQANEKENILPGDPRYDPDARRKKIAALKVMTLLANDYVEFRKCKDFLTRT